MPTDRAAIIRDGVEALNRGDWSAIVPHLASDVVLDNTRTRGENQRFFRGAEEVRQAWESTVDVWAAVHTEIGEPTGIGDRVVVPLFGNFRGRQGIEVTTNPAWLFTFRGDKVAEICFYQDEHEALEAAQESQANVEVVRSIVTPWERGDFSSADWAHPDVEFIVADGPLPGRWTGVPAMAGAWREAVTAFDQLRTEVEEYRALDDERVLVLMRLSGRGHASGLDVGDLVMNGVNLFHVRDGKVTRLVLYWDRERAIADGLF